MVPAVLRLELVGDDFFHALETVENRIPVEADEEQITGSQHSHVLRRRDLPHVLHPRRGDSQSYGDGTADILDRTLIQIEWHLHDFAAPEGAHGHGFLPVD